jgi:lipid-A-disaccharide synthase-like uncharacterized protein
MHGDETSWWAILGYAGTVIFGSRFFVQWIASERAGKSVIPRAFWYISIVGSLIMLAYACCVTNEIGWKAGLPLILAYAPNAFVYFRNLMLLDRHEKEAPAPAARPAELVTESVEA